MIRGIFLVLILGYSGCIYAQKTEFFTSSVDPVKSVVLFPNPATEAISVIFEKPEARQSSLILYTIIGNEITVEPEMVDDYELRVRVRDLPSGYYLLAVRNDKSGLKVTRKFLKR
jgi:hypothetical protein